MKTEYILSDGAKYALEAIEAERTRLLTRLHELDEMSAEIYSKSNVRYILDEAEAWSKLAHYEDLYEQSLILKLLCKVGDVLFNIENGKIESFVVEEFRICTYKIDRIEIYFENTSGFGLCLFDGTLDEGWYKTLAEAEKALEEMEK